MPVAKLIAIYVPLIGWIGLGWCMSRWLPRSSPAYLGKFLFWIGVPIGIVAFLRHAQVSWSLWLAPVVAWTAILGNLGLARLYLHTQNPPWNHQTRTSFTLSSMVGNTGYIGFPVALLLVGPQYFAWAVFFDMLGSIPGAYGLGVALAAQARGSKSGDRAGYWHSLSRTMALNPAFWSFAIGLFSRDLPLPAWLETTFRLVAWGVISLALMLIGMRLSEIASLKHLQPTAMGLSIKMLIVPLLIGLGLRSLGVTGEIHRVLLLQIAMPPAFATLVIAEAYDLNQEMAVAPIAIGSLLLLVTLPLWLWLFP